MNEEASDLVKEIAILNECSDDFIVGYKGSYEKDKHLWIAMELCTCTTLNSHFRRGWEYERRDPHW